MNRVRTPENKWGEICCSNCQHAEIQYYKHTDYYCRFTCHSYEKERDGEIIGYLNKHFCENFVEGNPKKTTINW